MTVNASSGITTQPTDVIACENNSAGFSVQAMGTNLQYQWQVNTGSGWTDVTGETDADLTISSSALNMNGHQYRVVINTDGCPPVLSSEADLSVDQLPFFTLEPNSQIVCAENEVSFLATAGGTNLVYQWQVNTGSGWQDLPGESTPSLSIVPATRDMDGYVYRALASNVGCLPVASAEATLTVNTEPGATGCPYVLLVSEGVSPNGDSELDHWVIQGIERYPDNRVKVYNVWGDLIFERNGYNNDAHAWRGESNHNMKVGGQTAPDGTYYYLIDLGDSSPLLRGFVVLKR
jgi:gliding motility-associated-like protein